MIEARGASGAPGDGGATTAISGTIAPPDISAHRRGNTGIEYATRFDSGRAGPGVTVVALTHGNELCGAVALDHLFRSEVRPVRGTLTLAFANVEAYRRFDPAQPGAARFVDEDLNRLWSEDSLDDGRNSVERRRARELRPLVDASDFLLDLHSMQRGEAPLLLSGPSLKGRRFARSLGSAATIVADPGHPNGRRLRDYGTFNDEASPRNAVLAECGTHLHPAAAENAIDIAWRFLLATGAVEAGTAAPHLRGETAPDRWVEVTHRFVPAHDDARLLGAYANLEVVARAGTAIAVDGGREITTPYDSCVLIMPARRLAKGQIAVRLGRYMPHERVHAA